MDHNSDDGQVVEQDIPFLCVHKIHTHPQIFHNQSHQTQLTQRHHVVGPFDITNNCCNGSVRVRDAVLNIRYCPRVGTALSSCLKPSILEESRRTQSHEEHLNDPFLFSEQICRQSDVRYVERSEASRLGAEEAQCLLK